MHRIPCLRRLAFALALLVCPHAYAQEYDYLGEIYGGLGGASFEEGIFGESVSGPIFVGGVGIRPFSRLGFEFGLTTISYEKTLSSSSGVDGTATFLTGDLAIHLLTGRVQPIVLVGAGVMHASRNAQPPGQPPRQSSGNSAAAHVGVGAKIFLTRNVSLRPQFQAYLTEGLAGLAGGSLAVSYHW